MVAVKFKLTVPENVDGIALDPEPDWSFDALLLELNSIERKITASPKFPAYTKMQPRDLSTSKSGARTGFVMQVDEIVSDSEDEVSEQSATVGKRFNFDELYTSDSDISKDQSAFEAEHHLMDKVGLVEGALSELTHDHHLSVTEEVRTQILALETDLMGEKQKFASTLATVVKNAETQQEMDWRLGMQYQRKIAEALDDHLIAVQRDHEHRSQIEERRIRDDAAREEAKKREKALQEEKARLEKVRAEAEMQAKLEAERIEKAKVAELEAQRKAAEEAAEKKASENVKNNTADAPEVVNKVSGQAVDLGSDVQNSLQSRGKIVKGAENALNLEEKRLKIYKELAVKNETLGLGSKREYETHKSDMRRRIRTISGVKENISVKADELIKLINYSPCPQSISIAMFAEQVVSWCVSRAGNSNSIPYAYGRVIVLVTSKVPLAMDILIAELNKVCIYTVPKHISYSQSVFKTKEAYYRAIGFQDDGKIETVDSYLNRLCAYMKLYGALVQTEVEGFQNLHGHREGWAWLARFLNAVPANLYTATALQAFLEMAGFVLYRKYKYHFEKLLNPALQISAAAPPSGSDLPMVPDDNQKCVNSLQTSLQSRNIHLPQPNASCDAVLCFCGIRLHQITSLTCSAAFNLTAPRNATPTAALANLERNCRNASYSGCTKCLGALQKLNGGGAKNGTHKVRNGEGAAYDSDRVTKMLNRDCQLMGLTWLLARNKTAYIPTVSAVLRAIMYSAHPPHDSKCSPDQENMPLAVNSLQFEKSDSSSSSSASSLPIFFRTLPLLILGVNILLINY